MAVSLNLYCNEAPNEIVVSCEAYDDDDDDDDNESDHCSVDYDDDLLINLFETEVDQMLESKVVSSRFHHSIVTARKDAIQWMLKVHCFYRFRPETAYLSISYMDRFLSARPLPQGKGWPMQLLSVSCLSLAAKMEETAVPFLLDLQIMKPRFLFKPKTVQRMEVLVMQTLNWRLRIITPFDFVYCFIARISSCFNDSHQPNRLCHLFSLASDLIINICIAAIDSLDYPPSAIAAAVVLWITNHSVDEQNLGHLHNGVNQVINTGMVKKIYKVIEGKRSSLKLMPQSPTCVLEAALLCKEIAKYC